MTAHSLRLEERVQTVCLLRRDLVHVEPASLTARNIALDDFGIPGSARDFEAARMNPVQGLAGILGEAFDLRRGELDQLDHKLALAHAADHTGGTRGSL
jgi:hypothetical protein